MIVIYLLQNINLHSVTRKQKRIQKSEKNMSEATVEEYQKLEVFVRKVIIVA